MKSGIWTTEFWMTAVSSLLSLLVMAGIIPTKDSTMMSEAAAKIAAGVVAAITVSKYIHSRTLVKTSVWLLLLLTPSMSFAQAPQKTCLFGWGRQQSDPQMIRLLEQIVAQQAQIISLLQNQHQPVPQPQQPQLIVLGGPLQQIPLGGQPRQDIPLGGQPRQDIPLGGPPRQEIPLGGPPRQDIPLGPPPRQDVPLGPQPRQQIPLGDPKTPPVMPPAGTVNYQRYTWQARHGR